MEVLWIVKMWASVILDIAEGQPDSIVGDIENMVRSYVDKVTIVSYLMLHVGEFMIWSFL